MSDEFEKALQRALRHQGLGEDFSNRVIAQLDSAAAPTPMRRRVLRSRWLPAALAACIIAAIGLVQLRQRALDAERATQARTQLMQALSIASDNINIVRTAVARAENPNS
ncbi:MAG TPA: hypothetical protein VIY50_10915 [Steroidobacteraceae bacterium]